MNYDELAYVEGEGRNVLEAKLRAAVRELRKLAEENRVLRAEKQGHTCGVLGACDHVE